MTPLLIFALTLFVAVLVSQLADRSILSTAVLFLLSGFLAGDGVIKWLDFKPTDPIVHHIAEYALFSVLFNDGMRLSLKELTTAWHLPGRALLFGLPLTILGTAVLAHFIAGLNWQHSFLLGAILSPTDPVFAAAIIGRKEIPGRLRHMLNVESGVNDGLALPGVLILLALATHRSPELPVLAWEIVLGIALGILIPWAACRLEGARYFAVAKSHEPLFAVALGLVLYAVASMAQANLYLAAFAAGATLASTRENFRDEFRRFGELVTELLKLAALLVFGALMSPAFFAQVLWRDYLTAVLILLLARPAAIELSLIGSGWTWQERITAGWFGPKGFASAIYGLLLFSLQVPNADRLFHLVAVVITASIIAHSSTDVPLANWFRRCDQAK